MLTLDMLIQLHKRSPKKVNLSYKKPGGSTGYCYISPTDPLCYAVPNIHNGKVEGWEAKSCKLVMHMDMDYKIRDGKFKKEELFYSFYKQNTKALIWVRLQDVQFQNKDREEMLKLIYVA